MTHCLFSDDPVPNSAPKDDKETVETEVVNLRTVPSYTEPYHKCFSLEMMSQTRAVDPDTLNPDLWGF
jgi:hypothetical protein